ncbi:hypothetical protein IWX46DRAFT_646373 [Phyllosticta citricarpa]|uniref:Uncharacterized protein n=1 Tax=Phyllosticta citricarpa TaxID=55181 RepID=A0ABR1MQ88_9PEZI
MNLSRHPSDPWFNMSTHQHKLVLSPQILKMVDPDFERLRRVQERQLPSFNSISTQDETTNVNAEARHGDSCLAKELRAGGLSERGFFGHPVLILSEPNEEGIVKIFPMTSFDGKTVEQKWSGIACPQRKEAMIGRYLQIAHPGIKSSIPEVRLANGQHLQKRTYLYTEVCWKVEASMLARFGHGDGLFLEEASLKTVLKTAARK